MKHIIRITNDILLNIALLLDIKNFINLRLVNKQFNNLIQPFNPDNKWRTYFCRYNNFNKYSEYNNFNKYCDYGIRTNCCNSSIMLFLYKYHGIDIFNKNLPIDKFCVVEIALLLIKYGYIDLFRTFNYMHRPKLFCNDFNIISYAYSYNQINLCDIILKQNHRSYNMIIEFLIGRCCIGDIEGLKNIFNPVFGNILKDSDKYNFMRLLKESIRNEQTEVINYLLSYNIKYAYIDFLDVLHIIFMNSTIKNLIKDYFEFDKSKYPNQLLNDNNLVTNISETDTYDTINSINNIQYSNKLLTGDDFLNLLCEFCEHKFKYKYYNEQQLEKYIQFIDYINDYVNEKYDSDIIKLKINEKINYFINHIIDYLYETNNIRIYKKIIINENIIRDTNFVYNLIPKIINNIYKIGDYDLLFNITDLLINKNINIDVKIKYINNFPDLEFLKKLSIYISRIDKNKIIYIKSLLYNTIYCLHNFGIIEYESKQNILFRCHEYIYTQKGNWSINLMCYVRNYVYYIKYICDFCDKKFKTNTSSKILFKLYKLLHIIINIYKIKNGYHVKHIKRHDIILSFLCSLLFSDFGLFNKLMYDIKHIQTNNKYDRYDRIINNVLCITYKLNEQMINYYLANSYIFKFTREKKNNLINFIEIICKTKCDNRLNDLIMKSDDVINFQKYGNPSIYFNTLFDYKSLNILKCIYEHKKELIDNFLMKKCNMMNRFIEFNSSYTFFGNYICNLFDVRDIDFNIFLLSCYKHLLKSDLIIILLNKFVMSNSSINFYDFLCKNFDIKQIIKKISDHNCSTYKNNHNTIENIINMLDMLNDEKNFNYY